MSDETKGDQWIIDGLRDTNKVNRSKVLNFMYQKHYGMVESMILQNNGSQEDARDVFQDAIIVLVDNISIPSFKLTSTLSTYLYAIARNVWLKKLKTKGRINYEVEVQDIGLVEESHLDILVQSDEIKAIKNVLLRLDKTCQEILEMFYFRRFSIDAIARAMNYNNENVAKVKKSKCLKKLREMSLEI